jgi:hypothetical protein
MKLSRRNRARRGPGNLKDGKLCAGRAIVPGRVALAMEQLLNDAPRCEFEPPSPLSYAASPILNARLELTHRLHVPESLLAAVGKVGRDY